MGLHTEGLKNTWAVLIFRPHGQTVLFVDSEDAAHDAARSHAEFGEGVTYSYVVAAQRRFANTSNIARLSAPDAGASS